MRPDNQVKKYGWGVDGFGRKTICDNAASPLVGIACPFNAHVLEVIDILVKQDEENSHIANKTGANQ